MDFYAPDVRNKEVRKPLGVGHVNTDGTVEAFRKLRKALKKVSFPITRAIVYLTDDSYSSTKGRLALIGSRGS